MTDQGLTTAQLNQALFEGKEFQIRVEVTRDAPNYHRDEEEYSKFGRGVPQVHDYYEWCNCDRTTAFAAVEEARALNTHSDKSFMVPTKNLFRVRPDLVNADEVTRQIVDAGIKMFSLLRSASLSHADCQRMTMEVFIKAQQDAAAWIQRQPTGKVTVVPAQ